MWSTGVVLQSLGEDGEVDYKWYCCCAKECMEKSSCLNIGPKKCTTNVARHLKKHSILSERSQTMSANKEKRRREAHDFEESMLFKKNFLLASEYVTTMLIIRCLLPQCFVDSPGFRFFAQMNCKPTMNQRFHSGLVFDRIVDIFVALKLTSKKIIARVKKSAIIAMFHLLIDEWWCKLLRRRFIAIRIRFIDENFNLVTILLSIRHYNRSLVSGEITQASIILLHWIKGVLAEFGLVVEDFSSATTDAGPDVKYVVVVLMKLSWEWCIAHMLTNSVKESCGWMKNRNQIQQEVKNIIKVANSMIARIKNSKNALSSFRHICLRRIGREIELKSYLEIRFIGVMVTLQRLVDVWECLIELYETHFGEQIPLPDRDVIEQLCGLFSYVKDVQVNAQCREYPISCFTLLQMLELDKDHLCENSSIGLKDGIMVESNDLAPLVKTTRKVLREAIDKRFYNRYHQNPPPRGSGSPATSFLLEMATVMHPAYSRLSCLDTIIARVNGDLTEGELHQFKLNLKNTIQKKIIDLAVRVANGKDGDPRGRLNLEEEIDELADNMENRLNIESNEAKIRRNFALYSEEVDIPRCRADQKDILAWWKRKEYLYPDLAVVARALLASEASSGAIELDIGVAGMFVPKNRLSTRSSLLEMKIFIKRNEEFLDWDSVECLTDEERQQNLPAQPEIPFVEPLEDNNEEEENLILL